MFSCQNHHLQCLWSLRSGIAKHANRTSDLTSRGFARVPFLTLVLVSGVDVTVRDRNLQMGPENSLSGDGDGRMLRREAFGWGGSFMNV